MPTNPIPEIPRQDDRPPVDHSIKLKAELDDFMKEHMKNRGDLSHGLNFIVEQYRDGLPATRRGSLPDTKQQPSDAQVSTKLAEVKKAANG